MTLLLAMAMVVSLGAAEDGTTSAEARSFYESLQADFDTNKPVSWAYEIEGVEASSVSPLIRELEAAGFSSVDVADGDDEEGFVVSAEETRIHTQQSFELRVAELESMAKKFGAKLGDFSGGRPDAL